MSLKADLGVVYRSTANDKNAQAAWLRTVKEIAKRQRELKAVRAKLSKAMYMLESVSERIGNLLEEKT